jgi:hypothetical protein
MTTLTKSDKLQLIDSRIRGLAYKKYGLELDLIVENAKVAPSAESVGVINQSISEIDDQLEALNEELAIVNALTE